jgi:hypothetical protein
LLQEISETPIGFFRGAKAGELTHRPELAAIAGSVYAARVGKLAWQSEVIFNVDISYVRRRIKTLDVFKRDSLKARLSLATRACGLQILFFPPIWRELFGRTFFDLMHLADSLRKVVPTYRMKTFID